MTTTGELFELVSSGSRGWAEYYSGSGARFIRIGNLDHGTIDLDLREVQCVRLPAAVEGTRTRLRGGDVLISITAELGMVAVVPHEFGEAYVNQHVALARPRRVVEPRFIAWFLASDEHGKKQLLELRRGATKVGLGLDDIRRVGVALPPLVEQHRIVTKIETLTAKSRRAKEALDAIPALLERFRQSVLASAFRGDLTADWRAKNPDVEPAEELLKRIRAERRRRWEEAELAKMRAKGKAPGDDRWKDKYEEPEPVDASELPELPEGWCWAAVEEVSIDIVDCPHSTPNYGPGECYAIDTTCMVPGSVVVEKLRRLDRETYEARTRRLIPNGGDVVFAREGTVGTAVTLPESPMMCLGQRVMLMRPSKLLTPRWLEQAIMSPPVTLQYANRLVGSTVPHLNVGDAVRLAIPIAPRAEEEVIMRMVGESMRKVTSLRSLFRDVDQSLESVAQAILAKAFRGELVPQDPNDEPASLLLDRLRAERQQPSAQPPPKPRATRRNQAPTRPRR